jgi:hypothetical protein
VPRYLPSFFPFSLSPSLFGNLWPDAAHRYGSDDVSKVTLPAWPGQGLDTIVIFRPLRPICILVRTRMLFALCMIWIFVCIFGYFDSWSLRGYNIYSFVGSIVNLCNCCYLDSTHIVCMLHMHESLGGAFPKRHHVDCGVIAIICKVPVFGVLQVVSEPRFCRYPRVQSACRITLPTDVVESSVKTSLLKMRWIVLNRSIFFSLPTLLLSSYLCEFEFSFLPTSLSLGSHVGGRSLAFILIGSFFESSSSSTRASIHCWWCREEISCWWCREK